MAKELEIGLGKLELHHVELNGVRGLMIRPSEKTRPVGSYTLIKKGESEPKNGDVVLWFSTPEGLQVIQDELHRVALQVQRDRNL